jgi:hypothetical protein
MSDGLSGSTKHVQIIEFVQNFFPVMWVPPLEAIKASLADHDVCGT